MKTYFKKGDIKTGTVHLEYGHQEHFSLYILFYKILLFAEMLNLTYITCYATII